MDISDPSHRHSVSVIRRPLLSIINFCRIVHALVLGKVEYILKPRLAVGQHEIIPILRDMVIGTTAMQHAVVEYDDISQIHFGTHGWTQRLATRGGQHHGLELARQVMPTRSEFGGTHRGGYILQRNEDVEDVAWQMLRDVDVSAVAVPGLVGAVGRCDQ